MIVYERMCKHEHELDICNHAKKSFWVQQTSLLEWHQVFHIAHFN